MDKLPIVVTSVRCPDRQEWVDLERCLACPALVRIEGVTVSRRYVRCWTSRSRQVAGETAPIAPRIGAVITLP